MAAPAHAGVERFEDFCVQPGDLEPADHGPNVLVQLGLVVVPGRRFQLDDIEPAVEQLVEGCSGTRDSLFVDLRQELGPSLLGFALSVGPAGTVSTR